LGKNKFLQIAIKKNNQGLKVPDCFLKNLLVKFDFLIKYAIINYVKILLVIRNFLYKSKNTEKIKKGREKNENIKIKFHYSYYTGFGSWVFDLQLPIHGQNRYFLICR